MERSCTSSAPSMEIDMMAQFLGADDHCFAYEYEHVEESMQAIAALFLPTHDTDSNSSSCFNYDFPPQCWPQPDHSSSVTSLLDPTENFESFEFPVMDPLPPSDFDSQCAIPYLTEDPSPLHGNHSSVREEEAANDTPATKKRKASATTKGSKKSKKASKKDYTGGDDDGGDTYVDPQSSSSCTSEDGNFEGNMNSCSKKTCTRASRGAATDPQSLYARKRRERINERLRILQNLVPNGTKVDISTMLEEAAQYVKFLQLQIKLLSSDDMWMYAPIAYNGISISNIDLNISSLQN